MPAPPMQLTILAFAQARDLLGWPERTIDYNPADTPRMILTRVAPNAPADRWRVALDEEYRSWDAPVGVVREMALIPPVSGG